MKKKLKKVLKYWKEILYCILFILISIIILIIGKIKNINNWDLSNISSNIFNSLIALISIWISGYFILIQLYKNTYPMEIIEKDFLKKVKNILLFTVINLIIGILVLTVFDDNISQIYFIILFVISMAVIFYNTYMINRTFTLNTYVDKYFCDLKDKLDSNKINESDVNEVFKKMHKFFDECTVKEEYYVCNNIAQKNGELFQKLIEKCNVLLISKEQEKEKLAEYIFKEIIMTGIYQIKNSRHIENNDFISELFYQQEENIKLCIKIKNIEWFKEYVKKINLLAKEYQDSEILKELYFIDRNIGEFLLKQDKYYFEWYINELYSMNLSLKYLYDNINLKYFSKLLIGMLVIDNEEYNGEHYEFLKTILKKFTRDITHIRDEIKDIVVYYQLYGSQIINSKNKEQVKEFIKILTDKDNRTIDDEKWNGFILYYLNETIEEWKEFGKDNRKLIIDMILDLLLKDTKTNYFSFLPQYPKIILENTYDMNVINEICDEFDELLIRLMINNNANMFYYILQELRDSILKLDKKDKLIQEKLFKICMNVLSKSINTNNKNFIELTCATLDNIVEGLDKDRKISDKFGKYIIEEISDMIIYRAKINEGDAIYLIYLLSGFLEDGKEYYFVSSDNAKKKLLYKSIYNIGISCIENNMEDAVRTVSNTLGWYIIRSIDKDTSELTNYIIDRTIDLYRIAQNMQISLKTQVFIMTLFTTVGTYCCKENKYRQYLVKILNLLKNLDIGKIKTAIELRTNENTMWDKLYDGKTEQLTQQFLKELKKL